MNPKLNRRDLLKGLGLAGIGGRAGTAGLAGFSRPARAHAAPRLEGVATCTFDCEVTPSVTEGPYYFDANQLRSDITEGLPGSPLLLTIGLVNADTGAPIAEAVIDVWHASASGCCSPSPTTAGRVETATRPRS